MLLHNKRITRKPVPSISTCKECGQEFKYLLALRRRWYCDDCNEAKDDANHKRWNEIRKNNLK